MYPAPEGAFEAASPYKPSDTVDIVVFPTFLDIRACTAAGIVTGAQYGEPLPAGHGARTGDVSMQLLKDAGCAYVLCGHSERREYHGESDQEVANQVAVALQAGLHPIVCIGETDEQRAMAQQQNVVRAQLSLLPLEEDFTIAYEPVWAIGTGKNATPAQAEEMHAYIRSLFPEGRRGKTRILYGGSVNAENAGEILRQPDVDGALVGGASRKPEEFAAIVAAAVRLS
jgi:triosephosphate isomerase